MVQRKHFLNFKNDEFQNDLWSLCKSLHEGAEHFIVGCISPSWIQSSSCLLFLFYRKLLRAKVKECKFLGFLYRQHSCLSLRQSVGIWMGGGVRLWCLKGGNPLHTRTRLLHQNTPASMWWLPSAQGVFISVLNRF